LGGAKQDIKNLLWIKTKGEKIGRPMRKRKTGAGRNVSVCCKRGFTKLASGGTGASKKSKKPKTHRLLTTTFG